MIKMIRQQKFSTETDLPKKCNPKKNTEILH